MKKILYLTFVCLIWIFCISAFNAKAQTVYGLSIVEPDGHQRIVEGYSATWLDYHAGLYYDPEVIGMLFRTDNPESPYSEGRHIGWADVLPAEVYLRTNNYVEGKTYCTYSQHSVWSYFYYPAYNWWFDPFRYSLMSTGYPPWPGSQFQYYYTIPRRQLLGLTQHCKTIPIVPPTPTPTPTPSPSPTVTPTPVPTPCEPSFEENCSERIAYILPVHHVQPSGTRLSGTAGHTTNVAVCISPAESGVNANSKLVRRPQHVNSGGHIGAIHTGTRPLGKLTKENGVTGSDGCFRTTYQPSHISGYVGVNGTIQGFDPAGTDILVRVDGLFPLGTGPDHKLIGQRPEHPDNHYARGTVNTKLRQIAQDYRTEFYPSGSIPEDNKVAYNDISLEFGGKFDLHKRWENNNSQHAEHRHGEEVDVRCNNIPLSRWQRIVEIFEDRDASVHDETQTSQPHWHLRFGTGSSSVVERTPHSFVEDAFDAALLRESTQPEYEEWFDRLILAKTQGSTQLLLEAKTFQKDVFASSEYVARFRTNEEFVGDVFWSHLLREPSVEEIDFWVDYIDNLPPSVPPNRRRSRMLDEFHTTQEFEDAVLGLVDPILSE